jgi:hypothetical protein
MKFEDEQMKAFIEKVNSFDLETLIFKIDIGSTSIFPYFDRFHAKYLKVISIKHDNDINKMITHYIPKYPSLKFKNIKQSMKFCGTYLNIREFLTCFQSPKKEFILDDYKKDN